MGKEFNDCLSCANSLSEAGENGGSDRLFCTIRGDYVEEDDTCEDWN